MTTMEMLAAFGGVSPLVARCDSRNGLARKRHREKRRMYKESWQYLWPFVVRFVLIAVTRVAPGACGLPNGSAQTHAISKRRRHENSSP